MVNRSSLMNLFDDMELTLFGVVEQAKEPQSPREESALERQFKSLMSSPIIKLILKYNPLQWVMEGIVEGVAESMSDFILPDARPLVDAIGVTALDLIKLGVDAFLEIFDIIANSASEVLTNPKNLLPIIMKAVKKSFKTLFKVTRDASLIVFDCLVGIVKTIPSLLTKAWLIPGLTDLWTDWTDQEFSLLNFATYGGAIMVNLIMSGLPISDDQIANAFSTPFPEGWTSCEIEPLYTSFQRKADQAALEAMYPGPSLPEHTRPIVMMVEVGGADKRIEPTHVEKASLEELRAELKHLHYVEIWMTLIGSLSRTVTTAAESTEAYSIHVEDGHQMNNAGPVHMKIPAIKVVAGMITVATSAVQLISITKISNTLAMLEEPNHIHQASAVQEGVMVAGFAVSSLGVLCDAIGGFMHAPAAQKKGFLCTAAVCFNLGTSANAAFTPGTWTEGRPEEICHVFGGIAGTAAVVTSHFGRETPWGPWVIGSALIIDGSTCLTAFAFSIKHLIDLGKH